MKAIGVMSAHSRRLSPQWLWLPLIGQRLANLVPDDLRAERFADGRTGGSRSPSWLGPHKVRNAAHDSSVVGIDSRASALF